MLVFWSDLLRYYLHTVKFTLLMCAFQWILTNVKLHAKCYVTNTRSEIGNFSITLKSSLVPVSSHFPPSPPVPRAFRVSSVESYSVHLLSVSLSTVFLRAVHVVPYSSSSLLFIAENVRPVLRPGHAPFSWFIVFLRANWMAASPSSRYNALSLPSPYDWVRTLFSLLKMTLWWTFL